MSEKERIESLLPGFGRSRLRDIDISRVPELNPKFSEIYFKKIRKSMFQDLREVRGVCKPPQTANSLLKTQRKVCPH